MPRGEIAIKDLLSKSALPVNGGGSMITSSGDAVECVILSRLQIGTMRFDANPSLQVQDTCKTRVFLLWQRRGGTPLSQNSTCLMWYFAISVCARVARSAER